MKSFTINVSKIVVYCGRSGSDKLSIFTDMDSTVYGEEKADMMVTLRRGTAHEWIDKNFPGVDVEVVGAGIVE